MTLIPMISSALSSRRMRTALAGGDLLVRGDYNPGAGHRPVAAGLAIGLPVAMVVAVALSPMIVESVPRTTPIVGTLIEVEKPREIEPVPDAPLPRSTPLVAPKPLVETAPITDIFVPTAEKFPPIPVTPLVGTGPAVTADPPALPPKLVLAQLDQRYIAGFQPDYPLREQREGIEGVARVRVLIGTDGRVKAVELVSTDSPGFFDATKKRALAKWRFKPATRGGTPEESWKEMSVRFEIRNA